MLVIILPQTHRSTESATAHKYRSRFASCGVLALMAAEAVVNDVPLTAVDVSAVAFYRR